MTVDFSTDIIRTDTFKSLFVSTSDISEVNKSEIEDTTLETWCSDFNSTLLDGYLLIANEPHHPAIEYLYCPYDFNAWIAQHGRPL